MRKFSPERSNSLAPTLQSYFVISCDLKSIFSGLGTKKTSAILDGFSWFKRHITPNLDQNSLATGNFMGLPTWQKYVSRVWFMAILRNVGRTKIAVTDQFFRYIKCENFIGLEILRKKLLFQMTYFQRQREYIYTYSLTWLKNAKMYGKRIFLYFRLTTLHVFPCQIFNFK